MTASGIVLVAEDDAVVRLVAVEILEDAGYQVLEVANADDAINVLKVRTHVKLVFSDVDMPGGMDGINLLHFVHDYWPDIRLLLTSGHFRPSVRSLPEACQFLGKPYTSDQLLRSVRRSLSQQ